jgi:hypothetical protein
MPCLRAMCIDNCPLVNMINVRASKKVLLAQIRNCNSLANVNLESTRHVDLTVLSCSSLTGISASTLVSLEVRHCGSLETLRQYPMLTNLNLEAMESLKDIPVYPIVEYFSIESCPSLITIFTNSHRLGHARVLKCEKLESIVHKSSVENGYSVTNLCKSLASIHLGNFKSSTLSRCPSLVNITYTQWSERFDSLVLDRCPLVTIPPQFPAIRQLLFEGRTCIKKLPASIETFTFWIRPGQLFCFPSGQFQLFRLMINLVRRKRLVKYIQSPAYLAMAKEFYIGKKSRDDARMKRFVSTIETTVQDAKRQRVSSPIAN